MDEAVLLAIAVQALQEARSGGGTAGTIADVTAIINGTWEDTDQ